MRGDHSTGAPAQFETDRRGGVGEGSPSISKLVLGVLAPVTKSLRDWVGGFPKCLSDFLPGAILLEAPEVVSVLRRSFVVLRGLLFRAHGSFSCSGGHFRAQEVVVANIV